MVVDMDRLAAEAKRRGLRDVGDVDVFDMSRMTGALFLYPEQLVSRWPPKPSMDKGCLEALIAQWEGLAPAVKMPKAKKDKP